jgi:hypothetical protein
MPVLGAGPAGETAGQLAAWQLTQTQVFVESMDGLFVITAIITALGIPLALMLRSGPAPSGGAAVAAH